MLLLFEKVNTQFKFTRMYQLPITEIGNLVCSNMPNHFSFLVLAASHSLGNFTVTYFSDHSQKKTEDEASLFKLDGLSVWLKCDVTSTVSKPKYIIWCHRLRKKEKRKKAQYHLFLSDSGDTKQKVH